MDKERTTGCKGPLRLDGMAPCTKYENGEEGGDENGMRGGEERDPQGQMRLSLAIQQDFLASSMPPW